jgi:hypothetical protein
MRCKTVAQRVTACRLGDAGLSYRFLHRTLEGLFIDMVATFLTRARVQRTLGGREHILPAPFASRSRILPRQGKGQIDLAEPFPEVLLIQSLHLFQVGFERCGKSTG